jgi:hypothetical protein
MRRFAVSLVGLTLLSTALALGTGGRAAWACSCAALTEAEYADMADVVFAGTLERIETPEGDDWSSMDPETYVFVIDLVFKGEAAEVQNVVTARDGASCGLEGMAPGSQYVVYASTDSRGGPQGQPGDLYSGLCTGTGPWDGSAAPAGLTGPGAAPATEPSPVPTTVSSPAPAPTTPALPATPPPTTESSPVPAPATTLTAGDDGWSTNDWLLAAVIAVPVVAALGLGVALYVQRRR